MMKHVPVSYRVRPDGTCFDCGGHHGPTAEGVATGKAIDAAGGVPPFDEVAGRFAAAIERHIKRAGLSEAKGQQLRDICQAAVFIGRLHELQRIAWAREHGITGMEAMDLEFLSWTEVRCRLIRAGLRVEDVGKP